MKTSDYGQYCIPGTVELTDEKGSLPLLRIHNEYAECEIFLYGAHIASFKSAGHEDLLWMSPTSLFSEGSPIRGGIPVCFPWFGPHRTRSDLPLHGIVRTRPWELESTARLADGRTRVLLRFSGDEETVKLWAYRFNLELEVTVGRELEAVLLTENSDTEPFLYEDCFHTYLKVGDTYACETGGLDGIGYIDRVHGDSRAVQSGKARLGTETVNAYMRAPARVELQDPLLERRIIIEQNGFASTVVWTPGETAAAKNPEIGAEWNRYLCIESANCLDTPILLLPGTAHRSAVRFRIVEDESTTS